MPTTLLLDKEEMTRILERLACEVLERHGQCERVMLVGIERRGADLARRLGISRASLYRAFEELEHGGLIFRQGKTITIPNLSALEGAPAQTDPLLRCVYRGFPGSCGRDRAGHRENGHSFVQWL